MFQAGDLDEETQDKHCGALNEMGIFRTSILGKSRG
jgi:hypothetical protein